MKYDGIFFPLKSVFLLNYVIGIIQILNEISYI